MKFSKELRKKFREILRKSFLKELLKELQKEHLLNIGKKISEVLPKEYPKIITTRTAYSAPGETPRTLKGIPG